MRLPDARFIPYTSERSGDGSGDSEKYRYTVEILAVIDYRIFRRSVVVNILRPRVRLDNVDTLCTVAYD